MSAGRRAVAACLLLCLVPAFGAPSAAEVVGLRGRTLEHDGLEREYLVYSPRRAATLEGRRPLVLVLHGGGGNHRSMLRLTKRSFHQLADEHGFYVVYPNAIDGLWDFGEGKISEGLPLRVDDLGFFERLLDELVTDYPIDEARIFATGISRGGQASYFVGCKLEGRIRAIAPMTMPMPGFLKDDCREGPPVGIAVLNGTEDPLVPYGGGQIDVFGQLRGKVLSTKRTMREWRKRNGCGGAKQRTELADVVDDGTTVTKTVWTNCPAAPVVLYRIDGGGHTWPSGVQYLPIALVGRVTEDIDGAVEAWSFFSEFE